jgi:hypothetical protein
MTSLQQHWPSRSLEAAADHRNPWMLRWQMQQLDAGLKRRAPFWKASEPYARLREHLSESSVDSLVHALVAKEVIDEGELVLAHGAGQFRHLHAAIRIESAAACHVDAVHTETSLWVGLHDIYSGQAQWLAACEASRQSVQSAQPVKPVYKPQTQTGPKRVNSLVSPYPNGAHADFTVIRDAGAWTLLSCLKELSDAGWLRSLRLWAYLLEEARYTLEDVDRHMLQMAAAIPSLTIRPSSARDDWNYQRLQAQEAPEAPNTPLGDDLDASPTFPEARPS